MLHAHGPKNRLDLPEPAEGDPPYVAVPYLDRMDLAYAAADLAICRSGAMTVAEVSAVGLPAVYVPLPIGNGEQRLNALPVVNAGGGLLVDDKDLTPDFVADTVAGLLTDGPRLAAMTAAAALVGHRDAAQRVAQVALDVAGGPRTRGARQGERDEFRSRCRPSLARVHMVGIGGAGMSGIARILLDRGAQVSGSDAKESRAVIALRARGAEVRVGHDPSSLDLLPGGPTAVITTHAAIPKDNPELVEARRRGIPVLLRPRVLAMLMSGYRTLAVTGTHGKTSTTSMLIVALQHCGLDPSFAVGGDLGEAGTNAHHGSGDYFVAEADESDGSLLEYTPDVAVVTNIDVDHLDFFGSTQAYTAVFDEFADRVAPGGALVACVDDPGAAALAERAAPAAPGCWRTAAVAGRSSARASCAGRMLSWEQQGTGAVAHVQLAGETLPRVMRLSVPGRHMALNALGALLAAVEAGAEPECVLDGLAGFEGVRRRFDLVGVVDSVRVYDDYAHHPTEIHATLTAVRTLIEQTPDRSGRAIAVFQPHLYSRTELFARDFGRALDSADLVFVLDVYGAREQPMAGVSGALVAEHVSVPVSYLPDFSAVPDRVAEVAAPGDVVVTMGAGDITMLGPEILTSLQVKANRSTPGASGVMRG